MSDECYLENVAAVTSGLLCWLLTRGEPSLKAKWLQQVKSCCSGETNNSWVAELKSCAHPLWGHLAVLSEAWVSFQSVSQLTKYCNCSNVGLLPQLQRWQLEALNPGNSGSMWEHFLRKLSAVWKTFWDLEEKKSSELVFPEPVLIPTWYGNHKLVIPMISVLRWEMYFS